MLVSSLTSFQIQAGMSKNRSQGFINIAVVPLGSIEQHGPRLPLNTDSVIAHASAQAIDKLEGGRLFVYPTIEYTNAESGMEFAGGISVSHDAIRGVLRGVLGSIRRQKYDGLVFRDCHAINKSDITEVAFDWVQTNFQQNDPFPVLVLGGYEIYDALADKHCVKIGRHADWFEETLFSACGGTVEVDEFIVKDPFPDKSPPMEGITGIPLSHRSDRGVLGKMSIEHEMIDFAEILWRDFIDLLYRRFKKTMNAFFVHYKKGRFS